RRHPTTLPPLVNRAPPPAPRGNWMADRNRDNPCNPPLPWRPWASIRKSIYHLTGPSKTTASLLWPQAWDNYFLLQENHPYESGFFDTGDEHQLYYERHGNPDGQPVVHLHGGPGAGCSFTEYQWFDTRHFNILLFNQRGAGSNDKKSLPYAETHGNTIAHLVQD